MPMAYEKIRARLALGHCRECDNPAEDGHTYCRRHYEMKRQHWREYYIQDKPKKRRLAREGQARHRERIAARRRQHRLDHPELYRARDKKKSRSPQAKARRRLHAAINRGVIVRPTQCSDCGTSDRPIQAHHEDYNQPFNVKWLCSRCHGERHRIAS